MADGNTNGTTETKLTRVAELLKQHKAAAKPVTGAAAKELLASFKKLVEARDKAQEALDKATKAMSENAEAMVIAFGDKKISVNGRIFFPSSRGEAVFYREQGRQNPEDILTA